MRNLEINKQPLWYALYKSKEEILDEYGNHTGTYRITYDTPVYYPCNVTESRGIVGHEPYGLTADYDRTIVTSDMDCPIKEDSVIWFGADPETDPYNYTVHRVANSLNGIAIAIRGVSVSKGTVVSG